MTIETIIQNVEAEFIGELYCFEVEVSLEGNVVGDVEFKKISRDEKSWSECLGEYKTLERELDWSDIDTIFRFDVLLQLREKLEKQNYEFPEELEVAIAERE